MVISLPTPSLAGTTEVFTITGVPGGTRYFAIQTVDDALLYSALSNLVQAEIPYPIYLALVQRQQ